MVSAKDFKPGELVRFPIQQRLGVVLPRRPDRFQHFAEHMYVWVKVLDTGRDDGWPPDRVVRAPTEEQADAARS